MRRRRKSRTGAESKRPAFKEELASALRLLRSGQRREAETLYQAVLRDDPRNPDALHFLGVLRYQQGREQDGIRLVREALQSSPGYADAHANLANMLIDGGRHDEAEQHLQRALALAPGAGPPTIALAVLLRHRGQSAEAEKLLRPLVEREPENAVARFNLSRALFQQGRVDEGMPHLKQAINLDASFSVNRDLPGLALTSLGLYEQAADYYRSWLAAEPGNPTAAHLLSALGGSATPSRAADDYVREHFDAFAQSFDSKLEHLEYRAPALVAAAVKMAFGDAARDLVVLDAGCGTGLLGLQLRPMSARLEGVDLSPGMLERARQRGVYDALRVAELTADLEAHAGRYDLVASADTLCYFGGLEPVALNAYAALKPSGCLVFTLEHAADLDSGFRLNRHGRYSHSVEHAAGALGGAGFSDIRVAQGTLRLEGREPVAGLIVVARR